MSLSNICFSFFFSLHFVIFICFLISSFLNLYNFPSDGLEKLLGSLQIQLLFCNYLVSPSVGFFFLSFLRLLINYLLQHYIYTRNLVAARFSINVTPVFFCLSIFLDFWISSKMCEFAFLVDVSVAGATV